ncbi:MAG TPA: pyridoxamine 5'-phosphate oxidase family protein [Thermomicrobiales bacterium]|nr:pyridoxamine 5'-phosphate oxidase family protein [Thermomicrobiales bacterium]
MATIPEAFRDLLDRPIVVSLATIMPSGQIQGHPVWADLVDGKVRVNTVVGRQKHRNLTERKFATVLAIDPDNPLRFIEIRGKLAETSTSDGDAIIDKLARDYTGADYTGHNDRDTRINCLIEPTHIVTSEG